MNSIWLIITLIKYYLICIIHIVSTHFCEYFTHNHFMLTKHNFEFHKQSSNRDANILFEKRIIVTEYFTDSSRFNLELKMNTESSVS